MFTQNASMSSREDGGRCAVRQAGLCNALSGDQFNKLSRIARRRLVPQSHTIFGDADPVSFFATILSGVVKLTKTTPGGAQHIITLMYPPEFLGFTTGGRQGCSAVAATEVQLCTYPSAAFLRLMQEIPQLPMKVLELALQDLDFQREWSVTLGCKSSYERVAGLFFMLARRAASDGGGAPVEFQLPLSRAELAGHLGLTLETVSRNIGRLKRKGLIGLRSARDVIVPSLDQLRDEADMEAPASSDR